MGQVVAVERLAFGEGGGVPEDAPVAVPGGYDARDPSGFALPQVEVSPEAEVPRPAFAGGVARLAEGAHDFEGVDGSAGVADLAYGGFASVGGGAGVGVVLAVEEVVTDQVGDVGGEVLAFADLGAGQAAGGLSGRGVGVEHPQACRGQGHDGACFNVAAVVVVIRLGAPQERRSGGDDASLGDDPVGQAFGGAGTVQVGGLAEVGAEEAVGVVDASAVAVQQRAERGVASAGCGERDRVGDGEGGPVEQRDGGRVDGGPGVGEVGVGHG